MTVASARRVRHEPAADHRRRLLEGMAAAVRERGFRDSTVADVVRHARTSRRTFYAHFPDKQACFVALLQEANAAMVRQIAAAVDRRAPIDAALAALILDEFRQSSAPPFDLPQPASARMRRAAGLIAEGPTLGTEALARAAQLPVSLALRDTKVSAWESLDVAPVQRRDRHLPKHEASVTLLTSASSSGRR